MDAYSETMFGLVVQVSYELSVTGEEPLEVHEPEMLPGLEPGVTAVRPLEAVSLL